MRLRWIGELRRVAYKARNDGKQRFVDGPEGNAILRAGEPGGVVEAIQQRVRLQVLIIETGFEAAHQRSAGAHIVAKLLALAVTEHGDVGQKQRAIARD